MNNNTAYTLGCSDVYRFFVLSLTADRAGKTDTTLEQLAGFVGESVSNYSSSGKGKASFTESIEDTKDVQIERIRTTSTKGNSVTRNIYTFKPVTLTQYMRINKSIMDLDLSIKLKGYIIKLFSVTNAHSYLISKSVNELTALLHMSKATINKYNATLIDAGFLKVVDNGFLLNVEALIIDEPVKKFSKEMQLVIDFIEMQLREKDVTVTPLTKSETAYLKAKSNNFENIRNMNGFAMWLLTGCPAKSKKEESELFVITF